MRRILLRRRGVLLCFFFQAEDGIRDLTVTGVQTCALPIFRQTYDFPPKQIAESEPAVHAEFIMGYDERRQAWVRFGVISTGQYFAIRMTDTRSEERRVGKECRSRWSPYH